MEARRPCGSNGRTCDTRWAVIEASSGCRSWQGPGTERLRFAGALLQFPGDVAVWPKAWASSDICVSQGGKRPVRLSPQQLGRGFLIHAYAVVAFPPYFY